MQFEFVIFIVVMIILMFIGIPIVFALGLITVGGLVVTFGPYMLPGIALVGFESLSDIIVGAIPMFVFMGYLMFESKLSDKIYTAIAPFLERILPGGLLHTNIVIGALFASVCGSSVASCASIGALAIPEMEKRGYPRFLAAGTVSAGATLGVLIPPSVMFIIYGLMTGESIGKLLIAGIIPGIMLTVSYMAYIAARIKISPEMVTGVERVIKPWGATLKGAVGIWPIPVLIIGIMGSIYLGIATPTEAAAIGCVVAMIIAATYKNLKRSVLWRTAEQTVLTSSMILLIMASGKLVGLYLGSTGVTAQLAENVVSMTVPPYVVLIGVMVMYVILGMLVDGVTMMVITLPIVVPIMTGIGYDPLWFGVVVVMLSEAALITPPVGMNLFIIRALRPNYPFTKIVQGCMPFFWVLLANIILIILFPKLSMLLPSMMIK